ncbi:reverse transcriptase domain-containing protein [Tanacetum coccineum]
MEEKGNSTNNGQGDAKDILSCIDTEEKIVIDDEYPEQKVTIGRQLPTRIKMRLRDLLRAHADVFSWTTARIIRVPRTLIIEEETFSTEHQLNVFNHPEPVKQKKRSLASERNKDVCTQVEELVEAGVLREVKYQTWIPLEKRREGPPFHENPKKLHEWKDGSVDNRSKRSLPKNERMLRVTANNGYTNQSSEDYFPSANPIIQVLSDMSIKQVLEKPEKSGRVAKWAIELGGHEIEFKGRNSIKGQILTDFLAETSPTKREEEKNEEAKRKEPEPENTWKADGLRIAKEMQIQELAIFVDFQVVANQVKGLFEARQQTIKQYLEKTMGLLSSFPNYSIEHIKREQNKKADARSKLASMTFSKLAKEVLVEVIQTKFGRPQIIISDNRKQFAKGTFPVFCKKLEALQALTFVYHPQANGQVEVTNKDIVKGMERRLGMAHQAWRVQDFNSKENEKRRREDLDVLEKKREMAAIKEARYKQKLEGYYNKNVKPSTFKPGICASIKQVQQGKIARKNETNVGRTLQSNKSLRRRSM